MWNPTVPNLLKMKSVAKFAKKKTLLKKVIEDKFQLIYINSGEKVISLFCFFANNFQSFFSIVVMLYFFGV